MNKKVESAFNGTVLEGRERRYTIINERDMDKYVNIFDRNHFAIELEHVLGKIEHGRELDGKKSFNSYIVINTDEPYVDEIIEVMKRHGHWNK